MSRNVKQLSSVVLFIQSLGTRGFSAANIKKRDCVCRLNCLGSLCFWVMPDLNGCVFL